MADGWFILLIIIGVLIFCGTLFAYWVRNSVAQQKEEQALSESDLRLMEDTVSTLIDRLKAASDEAVAAIESRQVALQALLDRVDERVPDRERAQVVTDLAGRGIGDAEIAQRAGITRGEVELLLELQAARGER
jgi:hypothetical protein